MDKQTLRVGDLKSLRAKTRRVAKELEQFLGIPKQSAQLPAPLDMLIATILSQNTNDKNSHRAYKQLKKKYPRWEMVAKAPLRSIKAAIRSGGMANQKSVRIKETLMAIHDRSGKYDLSSLSRKSDAKVIEELTAIKGVGVKTAACVLLFSMGRDVFPVDTHVHRICNRLGLAGNSSTPEKTFKAMRPLIPKGRGYSFHTNLIRFGRRVCRSNNPDCGVCPVYDDCVYAGRGKRSARPHVLSSADHDFMLLDNVQVAHDR